jgi:hypothetical protein
VEIGILHFIEYFAVIPLISDRDLEYPWNEGMWMQDTGHDELKPPNSRNSLHVITVIFTEIARTGERGLT